MRLAVALALTTLVLPFAHADWTHCDTTARAIHGQNNTFYWGVDQANLGVYLYEEANGIADLQRGGSERFLPAAAAVLDTDACDEAGDAGVAPDSLLF